MAAVEQLITQNLDIWSSAIKTRSSAGRGSSNKLDLYGIKKLRELILELAVRGLLVPQDPNDEPASVLLENIADKKVRLLKEGTLKTKAKENIEDFEMYVNKPPHWEYLRLGNLAKFIDYRGKTPKKITEGVPLITAKNIKFGFISREPAEFISEGDYIEWMTRGFPRVNDVLFTTEAPLGNVALIDIHEKFALAQRSICFQFHEPLVAPFLVYLIMSNIFQAQLKDNSTGMTATGIKASKLKEIPVPIPPLQEQHRIVAKVDELMALCDQLEQQQESSISAHQTLVETLLAALVNAGEKDEFNQAWARIAEHFDTLFTTEHSIDQLKQTILQLAVMGKLVPQNPNDEPASALLNRLSNERDAWLEENKAENAECKTMIKKLEKLDEANPPFPIPTSWSCVHLIQISRLLVDCHNKTAPYVEAGIPIIRTTNIRDRVFTFEGLKYVDDKTYEYWSRRCPPEPQDIMFTREAPMGEAAIIPEGVKWCLGQRTMLIRLMHDYISNDFLLLALTEPHLLERASEHAVGLTVKHLRVGDVERLNIPIPPLEEQRRIAAKVEDLMSICDSLKFRINKSQTTQLHLADAMAKTGD